MKTFSWPAKRLARIGVLAALASVLYYIPGIPIFPPIYKLDFSTLPALLAGFAMGPVEGLSVLLIKDLTGLLHSSSAGVGELADFLSSGFMVILSSLIYRQNRNLKTAALGLFSGVLAMTLAGACLNCWVLIPFYENVQGFPLSSILKMLAASGAGLQTMGDLILYVVIPFNAIKAAALMAITLLVVKPLLPILGGKPA